MGQGSTHQHIIGLHYKTHAGTRAYVNMPRCGSKVMKRECSKADYVRCTEIDPAIAYFALVRNPLTRYWSTMHYGQGEDEVHMRPQIKFLQPFRQLDLTLCTLENPHVHQIVHAFFHDFSVPKFAGPTQYDEIPESWPLIYANDLALWQAVIDAGGLLCPNGKEDFWNES